MGRISTPEARRPKPGACCYIPSVRELLRRYPRFFLWTALSGLALRLLFVIIAPQVTDDSRVYADVAKNWLSHGIYGTTDSGAIVPTYIRLPGYPAFLAIVFALFGSDNFRAVMLIQVLIDLGTCWLIADLSKRTFPTEALLGCAPGALEYKQESSGDRAAKVAFLLTALCPFLANYSAAVLTETLEVLFTAMALDFAVIGFNRMAMRDAYGPRTSTSAARAANQSGRNAALKRGFVRLAFRSSFMYAPWLVWAVCGLAIGAAILLRPDGGLLLIGIGLYLAVLLGKSMRRSARESEHFLPEARRPRPHAARIIYAGIVVSVFALAPLVPWTVRNLHTMHEFQPLAPRYANNPGDYVPIGFNRWVKTWIADFVSTQEIYWQVPGAEVDPTKLPARAFASAEQKQRTYEILSRYNQAKDIDPTLDREFCLLAEERIRAAPLRYYVWLPLLRIIDMWMRPRTELTEADPRWWEFNDELKWSVLAVGFGVINLVYILLAAVGLARGRAIRWLWFLLVFVMLRSAFLGTLENPEPRYTLECYPVVIVLGATGVARCLEAFS